MHTFLINEHGFIVKEFGNLFSKKMIKDLSPRMLCPILNSIFDELLKLEPNSPAIFIPAVNIAKGRINGYFDYLLSKIDGGQILWEVRDTTESNNNKLIRLQPEMEQKLRKETSDFLDLDKNCDISD